MTRTVLLIEDEPHIVEALSFLLSREGWNVDVHNDGHGAVEKILSLQPNLVILDVMLPNKGGMDILHDIRNEVNIRDIPVLMLTAKGQRKDRQAAEEAGANLFMTKPFSNQEIVQNINRLVTS
ncbi:MULTISPECIES: response regulator transcription factor [unclassified Lentilitoribacter]|jgi:DNA-binding response OmpR family regulator|uniref:response regulator transcription factor n=1 Tax=unclassified Lentilitoribacter TaxID=2647570 RepID=UPI0013A6DDB3|nr:response regulator [Lentilitoribacter sp. Alg239-R112]